MKKTENACLESLRKGLILNGFKAAERRKYERNFVETFYRDSGKFYVSVSLKPGKKPLELYVSEGKEGFFTSKFELSASSVEKILRTQASYR